MTPSCVSSSKYLHGSQSRVPRMSTIPTQNSRSTVIQWDTRGRSVAAGVRGSELDSEPLPGSVEHAAEERLDGLYLDQRDFAPSTARCIRIVARPSEIPVAPLDRALEAPALRRLTASLPPLPVRYG
jgi:hypothetical protein